MTCPQDVSDIIFIYAIIFLLPLLFPCVLRDDMPLFQYIPAPSRYISTFRDIVTLVSAFYDEASHPLHYAASWPRHTARGAHFSIIIYLAIFRLLMHSYFPATSLA